MYLFTDVYVLYVVILCCDFMCHQNLAFNYFNPSKNVLAA